MDPIAPGVTHGASISLVAATEAGDAALTMDGLRDIRLWPSLDGTRPPVPVGVVGARQLALGHAGKNLLAAILGEAGDVLLLQLGLDGSIRGRAQLPGDVPCVQVVVVDRDVLVVRADQSIERYDATAKLRARIVADPGDRIEAIAVRRGRAVVLISGRAEGELDGEAGSLRHLLIGENLRWGATVALPTPVAADVLALSPDGRRIAVENDRAHELQVIELSTRAPVGDAVKLASNNVAFGFTDDDHVAMLSPDVRWWHAPFQDAGTEPVVPDISDMLGGAIGDGVAIAGRGASLVLARQDSTHYLGWTVPAFGTVSAVDSQIMMAVWDTSIWLDGALRPTSKRDYTGLHTPFWVGPHHAVVEKSGMLELVDLDHSDKPVELGKGSTRWVFYEPALDQLAVYLSNGTVDRYTLDLEHTTAMRLAPLGVSPYFSSEGAPRIELLDPSRTGGILAIARYYGHEVHQGDRTNIAIYRDAGTGDATIWPVRELIVADTFAVDSTGAMYVRDKATGPLVVRRDGKPDVKLPDLTASEIVPSHDGKRFATLRDHEVAMFDASGTEVWRQAIWNAKHVVISSDDRHVIVASAGGLLSFDATTGARVGAACSFDFGLHEQPILVNALQAVPVCEAP